MNHDVPTPIPRPDEPEEDIERLLARNPFRQPPQAWRDALLSKAIAETRSGSCQTPDLTPGHPAVTATVANPSPRHPTTQAPLPAGLGDWIRQRLASGWTIAAAAWGLILGLNQYSIPQGDTPPEPKAPWSAQALTEIQAHQRLLADSTDAAGLANPGVGSMSRPPSPADPQPSSGMEQRDSPGTRPRAAHQIRENQYNA